jgi:hypothetical protein
LPGTAVATAIATRSAALTAAALSTAPAHLSAQVLVAARTAAAIIRVSSVIHAIGAVLDQVAAEAGAIVEDQAAV